MDQVMKGLINKLVTKGDHNSLTVFMDTLILTNRFQKTMGNLRKVELWEKNELQFYINKYKVDRDTVNGNINIIRKAQNLKQIQLPFYAGMTNMYEEHEGYKKIRREYRRELLENASHDYRKNNKRS